MMSSSQMPELPTHLGHKPLYAIPYFDHDGMYAGSTDTQFLSLGLAQWDPHRAISLKVLRHTGAKWSRQSEELPAHRLCDMVLLLIRALFKPEKPIPAGTFWNQADESQLIAHHPHSPYGEIKTIQDYLTKNRKEVHILLDRLKVLRKELNDLHQEGIIQ